MGRSRLSEEHLALEFFCNACLEAPAPVSPALEAVLDLSEAALAAGMSEDGAGGSGGPRDPSRTGARRGGSLLFDREAIEGLLRARGRA